MASYPATRGAPAPAPSSRTEVARRPIASSLPLPPAHIETITQSHERCAALGLSRIELPEFDPLGAADLNVALDRNRRLNLHAAPIMGMLFDQITGTESLVVLCDAVGTIIHSVGDDGFLARASKVALSPGVNWSEQAKGTNAIGTTLIEEVPTLVHADEHFMHANHFLTCSAAPILDPRGNILGVLNVSGDHRSYHQHTMALVRMSARMIENQWLSDDFSSLMRLHFHSRVEVLGTLMEGILAVTPDGRIVGANRGALEQLSLSGAALRMQSLTSLFGTTVGALVDRFRLPMALPLAVQTDGGKRFHLHARFNWPVWSHVTDAAAASAAPPIADVSPRADTAVHRAPSLARLRTPDAAWGALLDKAQRVLDRDIPMLLIGDTGTGKTMLASALHHDSRRCRQPLIAVNCANAGESDLFGTGGAAGLIEQAHGGTLLLDEIGALQAPLQLRLLDALQARAPLATGVACAQTPLDIALICTSQRPLQAAIDSGRLREDLFYRLNGVTLKLPALRERSDLPALVRRLLDEDEAGQHMQVSSEVMALFDAHPWPGNVRELSNVLRTAVAMAGSERLITRRHLPEDFAAEPQVDAAPLPSTVARSDGRAPAAAGEPPDAKRSLEAIEIDAMRAAVEEAGGNISEAAKRLGVSRNTIYRKLRWNQRASA